MSEGPASLILRAPNWLGDCIMAIPAIQALRRSFPQTHLAVMAPGGLSPLFHWIDGVDQVLSSPGGRGFRNWKARSHLALELRQRRFSTGILLPNSLSSAFWMWRSGVQKRIGTACNGRSLFLTDPVPLTPEILEAHQAEWYLHLLTPLGIQASLTPPALRIPERMVDSAARQIKADWGNSTQRYALIAPGSAYGPAKDWTASSFAEVARRCRQELGLNVLVTGSPADRPAAERIVQEAGEGVINIAGMTTLDTFLQLLSGASAYLGNDSGASHCAAAFGIPTVVIFGSTRPDRTRPLGRQVICLTSTAPCAPCLKRHCRFGPNESDKKCMTSITPAIVFDTLLALDNGSHREGTRP